MKPISEETRQLILKLQEVTKKSPKRAQILSMVNGKNSTVDIITQTGLSQPTVSRTLNAAKAAELIKLKKKVGNTEVYEKDIRFKQIDIKKWVKDKAPEGRTETPEIIISKKMIESPLSFANLSPNEVREATRMMEPYWTLYLFENSMRKFILQTLQKNYSSEWWYEIGIKSDLENRVKQRKKDEKKRHVKRGSHEIYYTDFPDLAYILNKEKTLFESKGIEIDVEYWLSTIKQLVSLSRNIVDHHNPLPQKEIRRLKDLLDDWKKEIT